MVAKEHGLRVGEGGDVTPLLVLAMNQLLKESICLCGVIKQANASKSSNLESLKTNSFQLSRM